LNKKITTETPTQNNIGSLDGPLSQCLQRKWGERKLRCKQKKIKPTMPSNLIDCIVVLFQGSNDLKTRLQRKVLRRRMKENLMLVNVNVLMSCRKNYDAI
jgi:hypothetical protein